MTMWLYEGKKTVLRTRGRRIRGNPRWLDDHARNFPGAVEYSSLIDCVQRRGAKVVAFRRTVGLGDLLMLIPVARAFARRLGVRVMLIVRRDWFEWCEAMSDEVVEFAQDRGVTDYGADVHYNLNSCLAIDHQGPPAADHHRCSLYAHAMGFPRGVTVAGT